jgi:two-component system, cell cycle response regulator
VKVLVAEDDPITSHLLQALLTKAGYDPVVVGNGVEVLHTLEQPDGPRLMVLDWMMPHIDGVEVCRTIRKSTSRNYVYLMLLTAKDKQEEILEGLEAGADDYITKPFDFHELVARLRSGKRILDLQDQLLNQATHDSLTALLNREAILEILQRESRRALRNKTQLAVIMADIDHFKEINDTHGHLIGDSVLRETAKALHSCLRSYDSIGRYGGEEFLIVAPDCSEKEAARLAERLRTAVKDVAVGAIECIVPITLSFGVADTSAGHKPEEMLRAADRALYAAKNGGRNRVERRSEIKIAS